MQRRTYDLRPTHHRDPAQRMDRPNPASHREKPMRPRYYAERAPVDPSSWYVKERQDDGTVTTLCLMANAFNAQQLAEHMNRGLVASVDPKGRWEGVG